MSQVEMEEKPSGENEIQPRLNGNGWGGARVGAGRKTKYEQRLQRKSIAASVLASFDEIQVWRELIFGTWLGGRKTCVHSPETQVSEGKAIVVCTDCKAYYRAPEDKIRLESMKFLTERTEGKAWQQPAPTPDRGKQDHKLAAALQNLLPGAKVTARQTTQELEVQAPAKSEPPEQTIEAAQ